MGDRAYTTLTIHHYYYKQLLAENKTQQDLLQNLDVDDILDEESDLVSFVDEEANYAKMKTLEDLLLDRKIEYDKEWAAGDEYEAGSSYTRNIKGKMKTQELTHSQARVAKLLKDLMAIDDPVKMKAEVKKMLKEIYTFEVTPLGPPQSIDFIKHA